MTNPYLVVIGASAGGLETLRELVAGLPAEFPAPIAIVMHMAPESPGLLPEILSRAGRITATTARNGQRLQPGHIYVAPPDYHLLVEPGRLRLSKGPRENRFRPAIDPLFRSAAQVYGPRAIGVILSGNLDDGTAGLWAIKQLGGTAVVQSPEDALFPSMPDNALRHVRIDHVLPVAEIPALLARLTAGTLPAPEPAVLVPRNLDLEVRIAGEDDPLRAGVTNIGPPSTFACPECHGVLREVKEGGRVRYRCHTGHAYSSSSLLVEASDELEVTLWNAIRSLQETALLLKTLAEGNDAPPIPGDGAALVARSEALLRQADLLRALVTESERPDDDAASSAAEPQRG
jgi:two-component system chemotaxis response regulator CheB